jgi:manganese/zinc/iron transport system ATP- binding protein
MTAGSAMPAIVELHDVTVAYGRKPVLWNVDLSIDAPCLYGIIGPNGAGKSTLVKAALGLVPLSGGSVRFFGKPLEEVRGRIGYVPQRESVDWDFPVSAIDVVLMGTYHRLSWFQRPGRRERDTAMECLDRVGLADVANRQIGGLSGGQQQRVFLARALAQEAHVLLLDEPFTGLDQPSMESLKEVLRALRNQGKLLLISHHDLSSVQDIFDRVILLNGELIASGPVKESFTRQNLERTYGMRVFSGLSHGLPI